MQHKVGAKARIAIGANLFLIRQNGNSGIVRSLGVDFCSQGGVSTDLVVLAIGTDQAAVQTDIHGLHCGHKLNLRTHKVMLGNTIHFVEQLESGQLNSIFNLILLVLAYEG